MHQRLLTIFFFFLFSFPLIAQNTTTQDDFQQAIDKAKKIAKETSLDSAVSYLDSLKNVATQHFGERDSMVAKVLYRKGAEYFKKQKYTQTIELFKIVQSIQIEAYAGKKHFDIPKITHLLGECYERLGQTEMAIRYFQEAARLRQAYKDPKLAKSCNKLGNLYREKGEFNLAEEYLLLIKPEKRTPQTSHNLALIKYDSKGFEPALSYLNAALEGYQEWPNHYQNEIAQCYILKASIHDDLKQYEKALADYQRAMSLLERQGEENSLLWRQLYNNLSITYKNLNLNKAAQDALEQSRQLTQQNDDNSSTSYISIYNNFGDIFFEQNKFEQALVYYQKAIQSATYPLCSDDFYQKIPLDSINITSLKTKFLIALFSKAEALVTWHHAQADKKLLEAALHTLESACQVIDLMRQEQSEEVSKLFWRNQTRPIYELGIEVAYQLNRPEKAYYFFEKSKAALLLDALKNETANRFLPTELIEKEKALQMDLAHLKRGLNSSDNKREQLAKIIKTQEELQLFIEEMERQYSNYYDAKYKTTIAELGAIQAQLASGKTTLIEYVLTEKYIYVLIVDKDIHLKRIPKTLDFENDIQKFIQLLSEKNQLESNQGFENYLQLAAQLYQDLIAPLEIKTERLMIVPDGVLNYIPFEALVKDATATPTSYLIQDYVINYIYSSSVLLQSQQVERQSNGQLLAIAPTEFPISNLAPLSLSTEEAAAILSIMSGQKAIKDSATITHFSTVASPYSILHLSTHASASDSTVQHPWIAFYDSLLLLPEIYHLNLNADLVVLSACETSKGDFQAGEGVMSLARGFAYAGIPSTITSLWEVNEKATADIMQYFYKNIQAYQAKDQALHQAKLAYLEKNPQASPYFWAAFVSIGNTDALLNLNTSSCDCSICFCWLIPVLLIGLCLYLVKRFYEK